MLRLGERLLLAEVKPRVCEKACSCEDKKAFSHIEAVLHLRLMHAVTKNQKSMPKINASMLIAVARMLLAGCNTKRRVMM